MSFTDEGRDAPETNVLPLLLTIAGNFAEPQEESTFKGRVVHAAVHGWMEGHLAAPDHRADPNNVGGMPHPPWPSSEDPQLHEIVGETLGRFRVGEEPAAVAFAASLGWLAGRATAGECPGCALGVSSEPVAQALRDGEGEVRFFLGTDGSLSRSLTMIGAAVEFVYRGDRKTQFRCPSCERLLTVKAAFPETFGYKSCSGCDTVWANEAHYAAELGRHASDIPVGDTWQGVVSSPAKT